ncbi:MAG: isoleucine--tRNA ligase [Chloroflexi bacterium]|nr:isoleucine--tRNA ligase [Chloroflexota bacterium]
MFRDVTSKVSFPELETNILRFWKERDIFAQSLEGRRDGPLFAFYEGPPTANGTPGIHHVLARVFKDVILRYRAMGGYYVPRKAGWDTHGLPVELEVERELGFSSKAEIEAYGVHRFNERCRASVFRYVKDWEAMTERIAFWLDMANPYVTFTNGYIESVWWVVKSLWDRGLVYQGYRVTPHCPRCGTSLSSHEVALGYRDDAVDPSVYVLFRLRKDVQRQDNQVARKLGWDPQKAEWTGPVPTLLAWTTTPWTLTGNVALAVAPDEEYVSVETLSPDGVVERLIMAKALLKSALGDAEAKVVAESSGGEMAGLYYEPLYSFGLPQGYFHCVVPADFVSMEEGTGIVHIAPAFGQEDFDLGQSNGLPLINTVDLKGNFIDAVAPWAGKFVKDADPFIIEDLRRRGLLLRSSTITHTYPFCWRCDTPLLYYAKSSWYIKTTALKDRLIANNKEISWYPEHIKEGRFGDWLENNVDWAVSRERYWGTPLPIWRCRGCGHHMCIGSREELQGMPEYSGPRGDFDLHRPFIDEATFRCPKCQGSSMERVPEVLDAWFDSGAMPYAQWHYPFDNKETFERNFPADFICEAVDQTRGWFYTLHALATLLKDQPCFKNVICLGHILDSKGEKMSKSRGNVVDPWTVLNSYGADALRWYLFTATGAGNVRRFDPEAVAEVVRKFLSTLWNTYSFFVTYANIDGFHPGTTPKPGRYSQLDSWLLSELNRLVEEVTASFESYNSTDGGRHIQSFVDNLSNWYVRRSRRRFWKSENDADKMAAYHTLYHCLVTLAKLMAPLAPFLAEELYQNLVRTWDSGAPESVHLTDFPTADKSLVDEELGRAVELTRLICSLGRDARQKAGIKVRQPLAKVTVKVGSEGEAAWLQRLSSHLLEELNVKALEVGTADKEAFPDDYSVVTQWNYVVAVPKTVSPELADEGTAREIVRRLQAMRRTAGFDIADRIHTYYQGEEAIHQVMRNFADYIKRETLSCDLVAVVPTEGAFVQSHRVDGHQVVLAVKKA